MEGVPPLQWWAVGAAASLSNHRETSYKHLVPQHIVICIIIYIICITFIITIVVVIIVVIIVRPKIDFLQNLETQLRERYQENKITFFYGFDSQLP